MTAAAPTVLDLIREQVGLRPDAVAVRHREKSLSYQGMWDRAVAVATELQRRDHAGATVALAAARSAEAIAGLIGILLSGSACLPLDTSWPPLRLEFMLDDAAAAAVVGDASVLASLPLADRTAIPLAAVGSGAGGPAAAPPAVGPGDLCYVIYTSGSTGQPKGVMQEHGCLANLVRWLRADSVCGPGSATAQFAPISFDVSFEEIFCTLASGGTLVCLSEADRADAQGLWEFLRREQIARLFLPFVALETLALFGQTAEVPDALREVINAGEQLKSSAPIRAMFARIPGCRLINHYGPTETHLATAYRLGADPADWPALPPIGAAIAGIQLAVLDEDRKPVPRGVPGQLWIGGPSVARGYWRRPELTAERFVREGDTRWYATGDLVREGEDGFDYLGRIDDQIKVRGMRIEPGEVEAALMSHPAIRAAAVVAFGASASTKMLVAFVVTEEDRVTAAALSGYLAQRIPPMMVPTRFERVSRLPLTPSGKVDRRALRAGLAGAGTSPGTMIRGT